MDIEIIDTTMLVFILSSIIYLIKKTTTLCRDLENLKTQLFNALGQNVKYDYYKTLHTAGYEHNGKQIDGKSIVVLANEENFKSSIKKRIYTSFIGNEVLLTNGKYDDAKFQFL